MQDFQNDPIRMSDDEITTVNVADISTEGLTSAHDKLYLAQEIFEKGMEILREVLHEYPNPNKEAYVYDHLRSIFDGSRYAPSLQDWIEEEEAKYSEAETEE